MVTGTAGPVGASFAVVEKNWTCPACKASNFPKKPNCFRCRARKPSGGSSQVWHDGALALATGEDHGWREALDPATKLLYYFNTKTGVTQWDRPEEMGQALAATGWYGRGKSNGENKLQEKNEEYLKRPAMKQVEETHVKDVAYLQGTENFNIYYGRYNGDNWRKGRTIEPAKTRLNVSLHAGWTQADKQKKEGAFFCINWAKGACFKGKKCTFFHRVPTYADIGRLEKDTLHDVFGRERHSSHRDDMQGVGSFNEPSRTLYVGKLQRTPYEETSKSLQKVVEKHFGEFGEVENVNVIWAKAIAFVRYRFRTHAELAMVAMANQTLDHDEILDVRWAHDDPNPVAREAAKRANADAVVAAIKAAGHATSQAAFAVPTEYQAVEDAAPVAGPAPKVEAIADDPNLYYPDTSAQYTAAVQETENAAPLPKRTKLER